MTDETASRTSAEIELLREALEPFAEIAKEFSDSLDDEDKNTMRWAVPTVGDIRRLARIYAALASQPEQRPFLGAECPEYPNCTGGCGLGCTKEHEPRGSAQCVRAKPIAWRVHYCGQWLYFETEAACEIYCHSNNKAEPLYQSQAKEPEASGGLCTDASHAVRLGEASADLPTTSEHMDVTAGETAPNSPSRTPAVTGPLNDTMPSSLNDACRRLDIAQERIQQLEGQVEDARASLALADKMLSEHIEKFHDFDYEPHQVPPELADLRQIEHHLMGSLILDDDIPRDTSTDRDHA
jgi:hypothetical protein